LKLSGQKISFPAHNGFDPCGRDEARITILL